MPLVLWASDRLSLSRGLRLSACPLPARLALASWGRRYLVKRLIVMNEFCSESYQTFIIQNLSFSILEYYRYALRRTQIPPCGVPEQKGLACLLSTFCVISLCRISAFSILSMILTMFLFTSHDFSVFRMCSWEMLSKHP